MTEDSKAPRPRFPIKVVSAATLSGFVVFSLLAYLYELHEYLTTPEFAGLDGVGLRQDLGGWFSIQSGLLGWFVLVGVPGALIGAALGVMIAGYNAQRAV